MMYGQKKADTFLFTMISSSYDEDNRECIDRKKNIPSLKFSAKLFGTKN